METALRVSQFFFNSVVYTEYGKTRTNKWEHTIDSIIHKTYLTIGIYGAPWIKSTILVYACIRTGGWKKIETNITIFGCEFNRKIIQFATCNIGKGERNMIHRAATTHTRITFQQQKPWCRIPYHTLSVDVFIAWLWNENAQETFFFLQLPSLPPWDKKSTKFFHIQSATNGHIFIENLPFNARF